MRPKPHAAAWGYLGSQIFTRSKVLSLLPSRDRRERFLRWHRLQRVKLTTVARLYSESYSTLRGALQFSALVMICTLIGLFFSSTTFKGWFSEFTSSTFSLRYFPSLV